MANSNKISWAQFSAVNEDVTTAFENLCRLLFNKEFFDNRKYFVSKHNHPGVEIFPVYNEKSKKRISFQAKFFTNSVKYSDIKDSIEKTIKYHSDDLDVFYLYCNKDINPKSRVFKECKKLLNDYNIEIEIIANNAILDKVFENPRWVDYFFGQHFLEKEWFKEQLEISLDVMGTRYNNMFNVSTDVEMQLKLFLKNNETLMIIEEKKKDLIKYLKDIENSSFAEYKQLSKELIDKIKNQVQSYVIDNIANIEECLGWKDDLKEICSENLELIDKEIEKLEKIEAANKGDEKEIWRKLSFLQELKRISEFLDFNELEQSLIKRNFLLLTGKAGEGKSQLLSETANAISKNDGGVILLPGHVFNSSENIRKQILAHLDINMNFTEFLNTLEMYGEIENEYVYIFIDAINESVNKDIWKVGLPPIVKEIEKFNFINLVVSYREGYEIVLFDENYRQRIDNKEIALITHKGFTNNSLEALEIFLNHYNIPFSPSNMLSSEMMNPLFLMMFCKTYDNEEFDMYQVLDKFIKISDVESQKDVGLSGEKKLLSKLIKDIAIYHLNNSTFVISEDELLDLKFWDRYGLINKKIPYLTSLTKSGILLEFMENGEEKYRFGYNLLEDFVYAKAIIDRFSDAEECKDYLRKDLLKITEEGNINYQYIDCFNVITSLYVEKFNEECIDIIEAVEDDYLQNEIFAKYIKSFSWRSPDTINKDDFRTFVNKKQIHRDVVFRVLIENSAKDDHPLNAEFIHDILSPKLLNERDNLWTTYINELGVKDERLFQLITFFDKGHKFEISREKNWLLLLLFSWLLTSSNRSLRDKSSKAMIELLKFDFPLCLRLLEKFENINDPYVIQRMYGIIFGVCTKALNIRKEEYEELISYIYDTIFNQEHVYPDILLRDYAKLIIEYFLFKYPENNTNIDVFKISPPYKSKPIPLARSVEDDYDTGLEKIASSMAPEGVARIYGDFGRYVFSSALNYFCEVDNENTYNYAMEFIQDELGYKDEFFCDYDNRRSSYDYDRHNTNKIERIGKKYQWIVMYNILARVSDHHKLSDGYSGGEEEVKFEGTWEPYVRDFDPTLNNNFLYDPNKPNFVSLKCKELGFINSDVSENDIETWAYDEQDVFFDINEELIRIDNKDNEWVVLDYYKVIKNSSGMEFVQCTRNGEQEKWCMARGYFVRQEEYEVLKNDLENNSCSGWSFANEHQSTYVLFNREIGWSSGYNHLTKNAWWDYEIETGDFETVKNQYRVPIIDFDEEEIDDSSFEKNVYREYKKPILKTIAKILKASNDFLWEQEYDASQENSTRYKVPCSLLINDLNLEQREFDGYYYDNKGELVAYYNKESDRFDADYELVIRRKHLSTFLKENDLMLIWDTLGEKIFMNQDKQNQKWSKWSGLLSYKENIVLGKMKIYERKKT